MIQIRKKINNEEIFLWIFQPNQEKIPDKNNVGKMSPRQNEKNKPGNGFFSFKENTGKSINLDNREKHIFFTGTPTIKADLRPQKARQMKQGRVSSHATGFALKNSANFAPNYDCIKTLASHGPKSTRYRSGDGWRFRHCRKIKSTHATVASASFSSSPPNIIKNSEANPTGPTYCECVLGVCNDKGCGGSSSEERSRKAWGYRHRAPHTISPSPTSIRS